MDGVTPYPPDVAARYRAAGWWRGDTLGGLLRRWASARPDQDALVDGTRRFTCAELDRLADRAGSGFLEQGVQPGDAVVLHLPNVWEFVVVALGLMRIGAPPVFVLADHREQEANHAVEVSRARGYVTQMRHRELDGQALARRLRDRHPSLEVLVVADGAGRGDADDDLIGLSSMLATDVTVSDVPEPDPSDVALFLLSGGTTGLPKLIARTHDDYSYNLRASAELCGFDPTTVYMVALPIAHNFPWGCPGLLGTLHAGGRAVVAADPSPDTVFPLIEEHGVTTTAVVPALASRWIDAVERGVDHDLSSLGLLQVGGARLAPEVAARVRPVLGCQLQQVFGMSEGLLNYTRLDDPDDIVLHTQGRPLSPGDEVRIVDDEGVPVPDGQPGRIQTRGPYTIRGYFQAPEANRSSFTADGFYEPGDIVRRSPEGNLVVVGRSKDFINRGGEKFSAEEVEDHVRTHADVADVAVVAMPDPDLTERSCAFVVLRPGAEALDRSSLAELLTERGLARFKIPDRVEVVDALPLTKVGKVSKADLRADIATKLAREAGQDEPSAYGEGPT